MSGGRSSRPSATGTPGDAATAATTGRRWSRRRVLQSLAAAAVGVHAAGARAAALDRVRERGRLVVGVYDDMPPFHVRGRGIDAALAAALAEGLGVALELRPFTADENMADDLRNMVWRGSVVGRAPADVLLHVPVDAPLIEATPQVRIFAPYFRETLAIARDRRRTGAIESLAALAGAPVAVAGKTLAGWLLIGADDGALRPTLRTDCTDGAAAAEALRRGEVVAAAGLRSELESVLHGSPEFVIETLPGPRTPRTGWAVGCAVRRDAEDLAMALQGVIGGLRDGGRLQRLFADAGVDWRRP